MPVFLLKVCIFCVHVFMWHDACVCDVLHSITMFYIHAGITSELLYWVMWEAVRRLEQCGLKVHLFI